MVPISLHADDDDGDDDDGGGHDDDDDDNDDDDGRCSGDDLHCSRRLAATVHVQQTAGQDDYHDFLYSGDYDSDDFKDNDVENANDGEEVVVIIQF